MKYKIQLSKYASIAYRSDVEIEANTQEEAENKALQMCEQEEIEFSGDFKVNEGWNFQVEDTQEVNENE